MNTEKKPARQIMRETFRYYEGSRILRELGYEGCGDYWWAPMFGQSQLSPLSFEAALRMPRAQLSLQQLYFEKVGKSMRRAAEHFEQNLRPVVAAIKRFAQTPQMQAIAELAIAASEQAGGEAGEEDDREEACSSRAAGSRPSKRYTIS